MNLQGRNLTTDTKGTDVALLQRELAQLGFPIPAAEVEAQGFGPGTRDAVGNFQKQNGIPANGVVDPPTAAAINAALDNATYTVSGRVASPNSAGAGGLIVQLVDKNPGPDVPLGSTTTDGAGTYQLTVVVSPVSLRQRLKTRPDLQSRVSQGQTFLAASDVKYNASNRETLDVAIPAGTALPSEHEALTASLKASYTGALASLQETGDRQDVTYLANKTGWDARAVALAALADQFGQATVATGTTTPPASIKPEFYYALFRAGLPANADTLYQANPKTVQALWQQAIGQGVIPAALAAEVPAAVQTFQTFAANQALTAKPPVGISPLKDLLQLSLPDATKQQQFAQLYAQHRDDWPSS
jgi:peptidoglycan hydrolase-like protein with peptidoglycan-binding domain